MSPVRAVFLDAGNTIFTERVSRSVIYAEVANGHGGQADEAEAADHMGRTFAELPSSLEGNFRYSLAWFRAFNQRVLTELGVPAGRLTDAHLALLARFEDPATYTLFPEVPAVLEELSNRGLTVGVVSNWSERLPVLLTGMGVAGQLEFIVTSAEMRAEKPERAIFERALFRAGVPPEEALHVGDHLERDVRGALGAGLRAALVDRADGAPTAAPEGVPVLEDLRGILALVEQTSHASRA
ncbi:MAG: HAD-IA family hydrolase [Planctomycetes bacterium]|nr:HAD-IA family hydrolase [Planctomycetota bacterium]MBL7009203.1 HAD-IA family hydrolase [Planctomycetota bacterium]